MKKGGSSATSRRLRRSVVAFSAAASNPSSSTQCATTLTSITPKTVQRRPIVVSTVPTRPGALYGSSAACDRVGGGAWEHQPQRARFALPVQLHPPPCRASGHRRDQEREPSACTRAAAPTNARLLA